MINTGSRDGARRPHLAIRAPRGTLAHFRIRASTGSRFTTGQYTLTPGTSLLVGPYGILAEPPEGPDAVRLVRLRR